MSSIKFHTNSKGNGRFTHLILVLPVLFLAKNIFAVGVTPGRQTIYVSEYDNSALNISHGFSLINNENKAQTMFGIRDYSHLGIETCIITEHSGIQESTVSWGSVGSNWYSTMAYAYIPQDWAHRPVGGFSMYAYHSDVPPAGGGIGAITKVMSEILVIYNTAPICTLTASDYAPLVGDTVSFALDVYDATHLGASWPRYRWDFDTDGIWDTNWATGTSSLLNLTFDTPGLKNITVQARDWMDIGRSETISVNVTPLPGAVVLGILGLGVAGVKLRKFV